MATKNYRTNDITIHWDSSKCTHAGICVHTLPKVYNPKEHPWIKPEHGSTEDLMKQINACPSGALSFSKNKD